ncbi:MAG: DedA family protein [Clostridiaceae bacterium]|jgi:membrane protein DedA with SNARE-associated domain|nr:DedA family protein [Clostridiaceae bacterium]
MLDSILTGLVNWIQGIITHMGVFGITLLMAIESCNIPLPSEAVLPFAGFLVSKGELNFHLTAIAGALGCVLGSIPSYYIGYFGGRTFVEKYGKYFLVSKKDLDEADKWVDKYGDWAFFLCRMLPIVRTFISLPAGILRARKRVFFTLTFFGSLIWSYVLVYVGIKFGEHIDKLKAIWHKFDLLIVIICVILGIIYIYKHIKHLKES